MPGISAMSVKIKLLLSAPFNSTGLKKWQWLHYDETKMLCFVTHVQLKKLSSSGSGDLAFISRGCSNWKDAAGNKGVFCKHEDALVDVIKKLSR